MMLRLFFALALIGLPPADAQIIQFSGATVATACSSGVIDAFPASPGAYTVAYTLRQSRAAYAGKAVQLQRSSDSTTLDIGFGSGCNPDTTSSAAFCSTATLTVGTTSSTRVAFPAGSVIHAFNQGPSGIFWAAGSSSVTATTASTALQSNQGVNITVGANTNIAALIGSGFGVNGGSGSATLFLTNCGTSKVYDQSGNGLDAAQTTLADQLGYNPSCTSGGFPCLFGCLSGCNLHVTDSATYKTATVETFTVMTFGEDITTSTTYYNGVGYPNTTSSNGSDFRWGLIDGGSPDIMTPIVNSAPFTNNPEGFGGIWRGQNLTQYDYNASSSNISIRWNGGTVFFNTASGATPTYPNAVGLYIMGDSAGNGTPGIFVEALVASGTQTARNSVSANQVSFWSIGAGTASSVALSNPLSDGFNWNQIQLGGFAPNPPGSGAFTVNGNAFNSESSWNNYTQWACTNCATSGGQLGDLYRFQVTFFDQWQGTSRSEVDGASGGAQFTNGNTYWIAYAVYVEPGTAYSTSWNITGQMHAAGTAAVCCVFDVNLQNDQFVLATFNATTGSQNGSPTFTSSTITRGVWYHFVFNVTVSTAGNADVFKVWCDCNSAGTMAQVVNTTGASLFGGNTSSTFSYWKYGNYRSTGVVLPTFAIRYGNVQACSTGTDCTTKYGVSDLSALETTPLTNPAHN
jgi:hypothetical protein